MRYLRTNTATRVTVGPFLDRTDGITPETALTVTGIKLTLVVDDGGVPTLVLDTNPTASGGNNDMVHITGDDAGFYDLELTAANVNYVGRAMLALTDAANHCPVFHEFMILPAVVYDAFVGGTDLFDVSVTQWLGTAAATPTVAGVPEVDVTHWLGTAAATPTVAGVPEVDLTHVAGAAVSTSTAQLGVNAVQAGGTAWGSGAITAGAIAADAITAAKLASDVATEINAGVLAVLGALADASADGDPTITDTAMAYLKQIVDVLVGSAGVVTYPAAAAPGNAVSLAEVLRQVHDEVAGLDGAAMITQANVRSAVGLASANLDTQLDALPTAAENADAVWDELAADHVGAGSLGERVERLDVIASGGAGGLTNARAALLDNLDAALSTRASQASVDTVDDFLDTEIAAIKAKTDNLPADPADQSAVEAAILAAWTTQLTEAYAADGVAPTPAQMMFMLWAAIAEFAISGTTITAKKLDGSTAAMTFTLDDATNPTSRTRAS